MSKFLGYDMEPGLIPLVVGVVSTPEGLEKAAAQKSWPCDVIEIRLDLIGTDYVEWAPAANRLTHAGMGTMLTIRHINEGGRWKGDEEFRRDLYLNNLQHVNGIDVELSSEILPEIVRDAGDGISVIGSFHNFRGMPTSEELNGVVKDGINAKVNVVKIAAFAKDKTEMSRLSALLKENADQPICAMAMGPMAEESRIALPIAGSCLTYGYLDKPNAPGQPSAGTVREKLRAQHEEYGMFAEIESELEG